MARGYSLGILGENGYLLRVEDHPWFPRFVDDALLTICGRVFRGRVCWIHLAADDWYWKRERLVTTIRLTADHARALDPEFVASCEEMRAER